MLCFGGNSEEPGEIPGLSRNCDREVHPQRRPRREPEGRGRAM